MAVALASAARSCRIVSRIGVQVGDERIDQAAAVLPVPLERRVVVGTDTPGLVVAG